MKNPGQLGQNTRPLAKGNSRSGDNCMQILKAPVPYSPGPVTTKTYKSQMSSGIAGLSSVK